MGANPVQIEVGEFDEAIEIVEDAVAESKFKDTQTNITSLHRMELLIINSSAYAFKRTIC